MSSKTTTPRSGGGTGTSGTNGTVSTSGTGFDPSQLRALTGGAKVGGASAARAQAPHLELDPDAPADRGMNLRTNAYDRALFAYVAGLRGQSVQKTIRELARMAALEAID